MQKSIKHEVVEDFDDALQNTDLAADEDNTTSVKTLSNQNILKPSTGRLVKIPSNDLNNVPEGQKVSFSI